jgi:uncharacterized membrane protein
VFKKVFYLLLLVLSVPLSINALTYLNFDSHYGFLRLKQSAIDTGWYLPAYYAHIVIAAIILLIGLNQMVPSLRLKSAQLHRLLGKFYVGGILFLSAPGAFVMSMFINRGPLVLASFVLQCFCWVLFTWLAYSAIRRRDISSHRAWMTRSFALTLAAITLRLYAFVFSWWADLSQPVAYATIAWSSWILNLVAAEIYIASEKSRADVATEL